MVGCKIDGGKSVHYLKIIDGQGPAKENTEDHIFVENCLAQGPSRTDRELDHWYHDDKKYVKRNYNCVGGIEKHTKELTKSGIDKLDLLLRPLYIDIPKEDLACSSDSAHPVKDFGVLGEQNLKQDTTFVNINRDNIMDHCAESSSMTNINIMDSKIRTCFRESFEMANHMSPIQISSHNSGAPFKPRRMREYSSSSTSSAEETLQHPYQQQSPSTSADLNYKAQDASRMNLPNGQLNHIAVSNYSHLTSMLMRSNPATSSTMTGYLGYPRDSPFYKPLLTNLDLKHSDQTRMLHGAPKDGSTSPTDP
ncbi:unnamed protein product, partial [Owenia fusiformis]